MISKHKSRDPRLSNVVSEVCVRHLLMILDIYIYLTLKSRTENTVNTSFSKLSGLIKVKVSDQLLLRVVDIKF